MSGHPVVVHSHRCPDLVAEYIHVKRTEVVSKFSGFYRSHSNVECICLKFVFETGFNNVDAQVLLRGEEQVNSTVQWRLLK